MKHFDIIIILKFWFYSNRIGESVSVRAERIHLLVYFHFRKYFTWWLCCRSSSFYPAGQKSQKDISADILPTAYVIELFYIQQIFSIAIKMSLRDYDPNRRKLKELDLQQM